MSCSCNNSTSKLSGELLKKTEKHPCYSAEAHKKFARMHLPVAPNCNISCNYCNRKFDCVNESRPGVTSEVLSPEKAKIKFDMVKEKVENLSVIGIAGPGDAFANWESTKRSIELIKEENPEITFCLSTNGLMLPDYAEEVVKLGVEHVTVTVNCIDSSIGAKIYKHINYKGTSYSGEEGAKLLLNNQLLGISKLVTYGVLVKINIVMIKGINDEHIPVLVKKMKELGVFVTNIMPLIPVEGSVFEKLPKSEMSEVVEMRKKCELDIKQMHHCKQCRADAIGLLGEDRSMEFTEYKLQLMKTNNTKKEEKKTRVAVTSKKGKLVDLHFGHATEFFIYDITETGNHFIETRAANKYCNGISECDEEQSKLDAIIDVISDCDAVLTMRIGSHAETRLKARGIQSIEYWYTVERGLQLAQMQLA
jgi:nitrogen fixation protein NifB